jgi:hypothetical protein
MDVEAAQQDNTPNLVACHLLMLPHLQDWHCIRFYLCQ